jgi:threonine dehydratase
MAVTTNEKLLAGRFPEQLSGVELLEEHITESMLDFYQLLKSGQTAIEKTPVRIVNAWINGNHVLAKCESEQTIGSFKVRGAYNAMRLADPVVARRGVIAASAGNHAQGVALAANEFGYEATIFMPESTPNTKQEATRKFGAGVLLVASDFDNTNQVAREHAAKNNKLFIPPFDHPDVIAGQATAVLEALEQAPETEIMYVPVGGGGFLAGAIIAAKYHHQQYGGPMPRIVGVESAELPSMQEALKIGGPFTLPPSDTIAEGIAVRQVGDLPYTIVESAYNSGELEFVSVSDDELKNAMRVQRAALESPMPEGAGAAAMAGAIKHTRQNEIAQKTLLIMDSGRNIDPKKVQQVVLEGRPAPANTITRGLGSRASLHIF